MPSTSHDQNQPQEPNQLNLASFTASLTHPEPPASYPALLKALWFCKNGRWEESHDIAQDIPSAMGSRVHGLLHLIEGDLGNAAYWYARAHLPAVRDRGQIDAEWARCVALALAMA